MKILTFVVVLLCIVTPAFAQTVTNPGHVQYTVSADHAQLTKYIIGYFLSGATDPVQTADLAVVTPDATQKVEQAINATPLTFGTYTARLRSVAGAVMGEWSADSNAFVRAPLPPGGNPVVKK